MVYGGIESILVGGFAVLQTLTFATSLTMVASLKWQNNTTVKSCQGLSIEQPAYLYLLGSLERIMALVLQIAFTMLVVYAVKQKKYIFLVYAILFHALVDFFAALYQTKMINIFVAEGITLLRDWWFHSYS